LSDADRAAILGNNAEALIGWPIGKPTEQKTL
jgi:hypothetical protein